MKHCSVVGDPDAYRHLSLKKDLIFETNIQLREMLKLVQHDVLKIFIDVEVFLILISKHHFVVRHADVYRHLSLNPALCFGKDNEINSA